MEKDVKPLTELDDDLLTNLSPEDLGKSFLLGFKNRFNNEPGHVDDIIKLIVKPIMDRDPNHNLITDIVQLHLLEAVQWLSNKGLLAEDLRMGQNGKFFITRLGHSYLEQGFIRKTHYL